MKITVSLQRLKFIGSVTTLLIALTNVPSYSQDGESIFKGNCAVCHTIGKGILVGPDLANVHKRRKKAWIFKFIRSSQSVIKSGDETAVALFEKFNKVQMPNHAAFTDGELNAILSYIESNSPEYVAETEAMPSPEESTSEPEITGKPIDEATEEDILNGRLLFSGQLRLQKKGPACLSCHNVKNDHVIGGGLLAKDLTEAYSRLNENGIKAILSSPPFPAMRKAYENHPISDDEAFLLTSFLKDVDQEHYYQHSRNYQLGFLYTGLIGVCILLMIFTYIWRKRKYAPVNQKIFNRQLKSESYY